MPQPPEAAPSVDPTADPKGGSGASNLDEATIMSKIEAKVNEIFASRTPSSPPPPSAPTESIEARIAAAVEAALHKRDEQDQQFVLAQEIEKIKTDFAKLSGPRKKSWGAFLVGPW